MKMSKVLVFIISIFILTQAIPVSGGSNSVPSENINFFVKVNPQFFNIIISDQKVVNDIKTYIQHANDTQKAKAEVLNAIGEEVFSVNNMMKPFDVMFIDNSVVLVYTYNPNYVYESSTKLALPAVKLKASVPITVSKEFVTKCSIYSKSEDSKKCHYTLESKVKDTFISDTVPKLIYSKEEIDLNDKDIYIFVDSSGNVLTLSPKRFDLTVVGSCNSTVVEGDKSDYNMFICRSVDHIDFSKLPIGKYKVYITFNKDNTNIFKIDKMSYKIVTCLREHITIKKETFEADKLMTLYFEKMDCSVNENSNKMWVYIGVISGLIITGLVIWYFKFREKDEGDEDIFE